ncbi:sugar 3,4-ketoisomerase [Apibacter adventoris]|uniref:sugar 3,4-ketoisomerase n=1 Tax=Apibacter adventoris TaxID=1679466 RepID=UPI000CF600FE|nr:FdtA/QdtA family cupin domain-containing protein [Apibacter adventoris]PQL92002.1 dTDP-6-deoxy-3,4-keto-hexulose isomerase [Apibacter adventoris]
MQNLKIINLKKIGSSSLGYITVAEELNNIPFEIKRVYWTYFTPNEVQRGGHAHKNLEQVIFAVSGIIEFTTEDIRGNKKTFVLDSPERGLYIPKQIWRDIKFSHNAVLLCLASEHYVEGDYIRDYNDFLKLKND